jgi:hypothetical protein
MPVLLWPVIKPLWKGYTVKNAGEAGSNWNEVNLSTSKSSMSICDFMAMDWWVYVALRIGPCIRMAADLYLGMNLENVLGGSL